MEPVCLPHCEIRERLGGFVRKEQLLEVYGVNNELYVRIAPYIESGGNVQQVRVNQLEFKELLRHPYLSYKQVQAIVNLRNRKDVDSIRSWVCLMSSLQTIFTGSNPTWNSKGSVNSLLNISFYN